MMKASEKHTALPSAVTSRPESGEGEGEEEGRRGGGGAPDGTEGE